MIRALELIDQYLLVEWQTLLFGVFILGSIILMTKSIKLAFMFNVLVSGLFFVWYYYAGWLQYSLCLYVMFGFIILLILTLLAEGRSNPSGGLVS